MVIADILAVIELCEKVGNFGPRLHEISKNVGSNFRESTIQLGEGVAALSQRVTTLKAVLEDRKNEDLKHLSGLQKTVTEIEEAFVDINIFFENLGKYNRLQILLKYRHIKKRFQDFFCILSGLEETLGKREQDITIALGIETYTGVKYLQKGEVNLSQDLEKIREDIQGVPDAVKNELDAAKNELMKEISFEKTRYKRGSLVPKPVRSSELSQKKFLCQGTYCTYYTAMLDNAKVVVKWIEDVDDENVRQSFVEKSRKLMDISFGHLTQVYGMCNEENKKFLVMEYMERGSLSKVLHEGEKLTLAKRVTLASSAARSLCRIHTMMVHKSLRTEKFLVDKNYTAKLSGMCHDLTFSSRRHHKPSTPPHVPIHFYRAPELFEPGPPTEEADIYAFGIVLWEIFTQTKPFSGLKSELGREPTGNDLMEFLMKDKKEEYVFGDQDDPTAKQLNSLVRKCRSVKPEDRPTMLDIESTLRRIEDELDQ